MKVIYGKDLKDIWMKNKKDFIQFFIDESTAKRINHSDLEYRFHDKNGKVYFGFTDALPLPLERWGKARDFLSWMNIGLSPDEFIQLIDAAEKNWLSHLKTGKNAAKVGYIFEELKNRKNLVLHSELLYNFMAVQIIREDEDPQTFNNEIHLEKVEQFKKETEAGNSYFFFQVPELKKLRELWNFNQNEWEIYWQESKAQQTILKKILQTILSEQDSKKEQTISTEA